MSESLSLIGAALPLVGVVIGATLQHVLSRKTEARRQRQALRDQAYVDYLRAIADAAHLRSDDDERDAFRAGANAKARIAVYGEADVISALAEFEASGAQLSSDEGHRRFVDLVRRMRGAESAVPTESLHLILIGPRRAPLTGESTPPMLELRERGNIERK
jgi:hypothetical protein